jgi:ERF superfamily
MNRPSCVRPVPNNPAGANHVKKSDSIANLVTALVAAKTQFTAVKKTESASIKTRNGGSFDYRYADLFMVIAATEPALLANGLSLIQFPTTSPGSVTVETILAHSSGEYISESLTMPVAMDTPQSVGSAITYARRYAYMAGLGIAPQDDDGATASKKPAKEPAREPAKPQEPRGYSEFKLDLILAGRSGMSALKKAWEAASAVHCKHARNNDLEWWTDLKAKTAAVTAVAA